MRITLLPLLLLFLKVPVIAFVHLVERQPQELWDPVTTFGATLTLLGGVGTYLVNGVGNLFQNPQESDTSKTIPPPDSLTVSPAPASATSSSAEPVYKINIQNDQSKAPNTDTVPNLSVDSPNEECDVSLHICFLQATLARHDPYVRSD